VANWNPASGAMAAPSLSKCLIFSARALDDLWSHDDLSHNNFNSFTEQLEPGLRRSDVLHQDVLRLPSQL
jgi:hypothetical protein